MSVRASDPDTSLEAWVSLHPELSRERAIVLTAMDLSGWHGATADEVVDRLAARGIQRPRNCVSSRLSELRNMGLLEDRGHRRVSEYSGKRAIVFHRVWS